MNDQCWTGRCVNSVEQHQALRHLKWVASDRSLHGSCVPTVPSSHGSSTFDTCNAFSASGNEIQQIKKVSKTKQGGGGKPLGLAYIHNSQNLIQNKVAAGIPHFSKF